MNLHFAELGCSKYVSLKNRNLTAKNGKLVGEISCTKSSNELIHTQALHCAQAFELISETGLSPLIYSPLERLCEPNLTCKAGLVPCIEEDADKYDSWDLSIAQKSLDDIPSEVSKTAFEKGWQWIEDNPFKAGFIGGIIGTGAIITGLQAYQAVQKSNAASDALKVEKRAVSNKLPINYVPEGKASFMSGLRLKDQPIGTDVDFYIYRCGGTIISQNQVLTAAHCLESFQDGWGEPIKPVTADRLVVMHGANNWEKMFNNKDTMQFNVINIDKHDGYFDDKGGAVVNDYAIVTINGSFPDTACAMPLINATEYQKMTQLQHIGQWTEAANSTIRPDMFAMGFGKPPDDLKRVKDLKYVELQQIQPIFPCVGTEPSHLCAANNYHGVVGRKKLRRDTCSGDSGGPLLWFNQETQKTVHAGVVSYGDVCGKKPAVYANTYTGRNWIDARKNQNSHLRECQKEDIFVPEDLFLRSTTAKPQTTPLQTGITTQSTAIITPTPKLNFTNVPNTHMVNGVGVSVGLAGGLVFAGAGYLSYKKRADDKNHATPAIALQLQSMLEEHESENE